jgi:hypothetical protein
MCWDLECLPMQQRVGTHMKVQWNPEVRCCKGESRKPGSAPRLTCSELAKKSQCMSNALFVPTSRLLGAQNDSFRVLLFLCKQDLRPGIAPIHQIAPRFFLYLLLRYLHFRFVRLAVSYCSSPPPSCTSDPSAVLEATGIVSAHVRS